MKNFILLVVILSALLWRGVGGEVFAQQDAQYSMYMFNPIALNPAYAGSREVLSSTLVYRNQWAVLDGAPHTNSFSLQSPLRNNKIGMGIELLSDKLGPQNTTSVLLSYAYRIQLKKGKLALGLRSGIYNYAFDKIEYKDATDNLGLKNPSSKTTGTADFGMYYYNRTFYWGLGVTHLNKGKTTDIDSNDARQYVHFFMPIGKAFELGSVVMNPTMLIKGAGNSPSEIDLGLNVLLKERLWVGLSSRSHYGIVFMTQFLINDKFRVGYSYDRGRNNNKIGIAGKGSHEIMIAYDITIHGTRMMMPRYL